MQRTLVLLKPDAVGRRLVGRIVDRIERKGLKIVAMKMLRVAEPAAREMYAEHEGKGFHAPLLEFLTSGPSVAMAVEGLEAIGVVRRLLGATSAPEAAPGSVRGDFGLSRRHNLAHGSDSPQAAEREIELLFRPEELMDYEPAADGWIYGRLADGRRT